MTIVVRPSHHLGQRVADLVLLGRVDRRRGVVEDQHPRVGEDRPGDGDALALAARQREAPLADHGVVALGQLVDELVGAGQPGRPLDPLLRRVGVGEGDVGRTVSLNRNVSSNTMPTAVAQVVQLDVAHVDAVEQDRARRRRRRSGGCSRATVVLPQPVGPDERDRLARPDREVEAVEHRPVAPGE